MKIATYNINGIKARLPALLEWLAEAQPDVALLQEIKSVDEGFPRLEIEELGYNIETHGQKGFNGVAILSKHPIEDVARGLPGDDSDEQARWIEATIMGEKDAVRVCGLYLPNGNPAPGPKYDYKMAWMERMEARALDLIISEEIALMAGDYNVIPESIDAENPKKWLTDALFLPQTRAAWRRIVNLGFSDAIRETTQADHVYSFWDYQRGAWERNDGIRIDHFLLTPQAADRLTAAGIDSTVRGREKPSDHVPVWITLEI
jgi:exodeoxyribonuclease-3